MNINQLIKIKNKKGLQPSWLKFHPFTSHILGSPSYVDYSVWNGYHIFMRFPYGYLRYDSIQFTRRFLCFSPLTGIFCNI